METLCQKHPGMVDIGGYYHAKRLSNDKWGLYGGFYTSYRQGCSVGYLAAIRGLDGKLLRFDSFDTLVKYVFGR
jgi:hypothetical protein